MSTITTAEELLKLRFKKEKHPNLGTGYTKNTSKSPGYRVYLFVDLNFTKRTKKPYHTVWLISETGPYKTIGIQEDKIIVGWTKKEDGINTVEGIIKLWETIAGKKLKI